MSYIIMSFNVFKMGEQAAEQRLKDWRLIARIVKNNMADIVALQEVFSPRPVEELKRNLNLYGGNWDFRFEQKDTIRNEREGYAFIWNKNRIDLLQVDGKIYEPHIEAKWTSKSLIRPPYVGRFIPVHIGAPFIELRLINTHIIFSKDKYSLNQNNDLSSLQMRKNEYRTLSKKVFPRIAHERMGNFRVSYTFINGDYNLPLNTCNIIDKDPLEERMFMISYQGAKTTISTENSKNSPFEDAYVNDYDHFTFSDHEQDYVASAERIDAPRLFCRGSFKEYRENVSDHVPIKLTFSLRH